jgi:ADP-heptose:LPS heptosyltransferase
LPPSIQAYRVQPDALFTDGLPFDLLPPEIKLTNFSDTARWLETLDLIITVDTSVAHLAGAMGIPVWILLPYAPDWRWGTDGETTRWYGSARLFRQPQPNDWQSVLQSVQQTLETGAA